MVRLILINKLFGLVIAIARTAVIKKIDLQAGGVSRTHTLQNTLSFRVRALFMSPNLFRVWYNVRGRASEVEGPGVGGTVER